MILNLTFDASVANAPVGFTAALTSVANFFQTSFSDPVTVNIAAGYGEVDGQALGAGALGTSVTRMNGYSYAQLKGAFAADASSATDASAVASLPSTDPVGTTYTVPAAEAKALGLSSSTGPDGWVGFSSTPGIFDYNFSDGITAGKYDFFATAAHEISEVLGREMWDGQQSIYTPLDLFHFSAAGVRSFTGSAPGYFSADNGVTNLNNFNSNSGGDYGDWASSAGHDAFNAFANGGVIEAISASDMKEMDTLGWDVVSGPDLTVSNFVANLTSVSFSVDNIGNASAGASVAAVYLSSDTAITAGDILLASAAAPALAAGASVNENASFVLPSNLAPGTYYLGALADSGNQVTEAKESNNGSLVSPVILGNGSDNVLVGTSGGDTMWGFGGNDTLDGGAGKDTMIGGSGNDTYVIDKSGDVIVENPGEGIDTVKASIAYTLGANLENLTLTGSVNLNGTGNAADNLLTGNSGNNTLAGLAGADALDGGAGIDTATYSASATGVNVCLATGHGTGGDAQGDVLFNIENVTGSKHNDVIEGNGGANVLAGAGGNDTLSYDHASSGVTVNLLLTTPQITGGAGTDTISGFENITGSDYGDSLTGSAAANAMTGGNGDDRIDGGAGADKILGGNGNDVLLGSDGNDSLTGGAGSDTLTGGLGADRFIYTALGDAPAGAAHDVIADFTHADNDKIDLSAIDANTLLAGDQAFVFIAGLDFHHLAGELHDLPGGTGSTVSGDVNGDGIPDFSVDVNVASLVATDFIL